MALVVKNPPDNAGNIRDTGSIPGSGGSPGGGRGNLLQYSCLENPMDRGAWPTTVHGIAKSQTQLKRFSTYMHCTWLNVGTEAQGDFPTLCPDLEAEEESERLG